MRGHIIKHGDRFHVVTGVTKTHYKTLRCTKYAAFEDVVPKSEAEDIGLLRLNGPHGKHQQRYWYVTLVCEHGYYRQTVVTRQIKDGYEETRKMWIRAWVVSAMIELRLLIILADICEPDDPDEGNFY